jgi:hypothetical protein
MYTTMPLETVFEGIEAMRAASFTATLGGVSMELEPYGERQARIVRLLSPDPQQYLRPELAPGAIVSMMPIVGEPG